MSQVSTNEEIFPSIEEVNFTRRKLKYSVPANSVKNAFNSATSELQSSAEIRGFRKGKAPVALVRKFYINDIVKKAADKIINDVYSKSLKKVDFQIVSQPHIEPESQFDENNEFKFSATVDINPKIDMKDYQSLSIKLPASLKINIDEQYEKLIGSYQKAFSKTELVQEDRIAQKGDLAKVNYSVFFESKELESKKAVNQIIEFNGSSFPELEEALVTMKVGDSKVVSVHVPENYKDAELQGKQIELHLSLNSLEKFILEDMNDDFAKRLGYETMDVAKTKIMETLEQNHVDMKVNAAFEQIVDQVLAKNEFEVAESLVESTIDRAIQEANSTNKDNSNKIDPENPNQRENFRELALKNVRGILALGHVARQENITVSDEELYRDITNFAMANRVNPRDLFKNGNQLFDEFRGQAMIRKVVNKLLESAQIEYN